MGCRDNIMGDTHGVISFRRVLLRHIPALGDSYLAQMKE